MGKSECSKKHQHSKYLALLLPDKLRHFLLQMGWSRGHPKTEPKVEAMEERKIKNVRKAEDRKHAITESDGVDDGGSKWGRSMVRIRTRIRIRIRKGKREGQESDLVFLVRFPAAS